MSNPTNDHLVLIAGSSATGKSASLANLNDKPNWIYLNCEANKKLPFADGKLFKSSSIQDPLQVNDAFEYLANKPEMKGIIIDSITFLLRMYEEQYVNTAVNTLQAWGTYTTFFSNLMQKDVASCTRPVVMLAHNSDFYDEKTMNLSTSVPCKGALSKVGIESYFSTVLYSKQMSIKDLEGYSNPLLNITDEERAIGVKYVFQTRLTKNTVNTRIRSPMGMWSTQETFIDNDTQAVLKRLEEYYS